MNPPATSVWLHRFAWFTVALTILLPVSTGATVTTIKAGMVFADWPSSNGYFILSYPWLSAARDEFVEHGHRLSGTVIGSREHLPGNRRLENGSPSDRAEIGDRDFRNRVGPGNAWWCPRVCLIKQTLAFLHGDFAAVVVSLMATLVLVTSRGWEQRPRLNSVEASRLVGGTATFLLAMLIAQYVMGGFLRHLRERFEFAWAWMVHPWFALVVLFATVVFAFSVRGSASPHLRNCAWAMIGLTVAQSLLGLATWYVRYGIPSWGVVAQQDSMPQIVICSLHTVLGMLTLIASVLTVICCQAVKPLQQWREATMQVGPNVAGAAT